MEELGTVISFTWMENPDAADELRGRSRSVIHSLAESVSDDKLRSGFLKSKSVRELEG